jgi:hypothetical protein
MEGSDKYHRFVVIEFPSLEQAVKGVPEEVKVWRRDVEEGSGPDQGTIEGGRQARQGAGR